MGNRARAKRWSTIDKDSMVDNERISMNTRNCGCREIKRSDEAGTVSGTKRFRTWYDMVQATINYRPIDRYNA